jgi:hypothetical protein
MEGSSPARSEHRSKPVSQPPGNVGRPVQHDYEVLQRVVFEILDTKPANWVNGKLGVLLASVRNRMGQDAPGRSQFYEKIRPKIENHRTQRSAKAVRQSGNAKVR